MQEMWPAEEGIVLIKDAIADCRICPMEKQWKLPFPKNGSLVVDGNELDWWEWVLHHVHRWQDETYIHVLPENKIRRSLSFEETKDKSLIH